MALHRDIYWVGRQWAVTGYGIQAIDRKLNGKFDVDAARLWEEGLLENMREEAWLNSQDFEKALSVARKRFPETARKPAPPEQSVLGLMETVIKETNQKQAKFKETGLKEPPIERPKPLAQKFDMRIEGWPAKFLRPWRIRIRR